MKSIHNLLRRPNADLDEFSVKEQLHNVIVNAPLDQAEAGDLSPAKTLVLEHIERLVKSPNLSDDQARRILDRFNQIAVDVLLS